MARNRRGPKNVVDFAPYPATLTLEEYGERRDICTGRELQKLTASKGFNDYLHQAKPKSGPRSRSWYAVILALSILLGGLTWSLMDPSSSIGQFVTTTVEDTKSQLPDTFLHSLNIPKDQTIYKKEYQKIIDLEANIWYDSHKIKELEAKNSVLQEKLQDLSKPEISSKVDASKEGSSNHASPSLETNFFPSLTINGSNELSHESDSDLDFSERRDLEAWAASADFFITTTTILGVSLALMLLSLYKLLQNLNQTRTRLQQAETLLEKEGPEILKETVKKAKESEVARLKAENDLQESREAFQRLQTELGNQEQDYMAQSNSMRENLSRKERELDSRQQEVDHLKFSLSASEEKVANIEATLSSKSNQLQGSEAKVQEFEKQIEEFEKKIQEFMEKEESQKGEVVSLQYVVRELEGENGLLKERVHNAEQDSVEKSRLISRSENEKNDLKHEVNMVKEDNDGLQKYVKEREDSLVLSERQKTSLKADTERLKETLESAKADNKNKTTILAQKEAELNSIKNESQISQEQSQKQLEESAEEIKFLSTECDAATEQVEALLKDVSATESKNKVLEDAHNDVQEEVQELRQRYDEQVKKVEALEEELTSLKIQNIELKNISGPPSSPPGLSEREPESRIPRPNLNTNGNISETLHPIQEHGPTPVGSQGSGLTQTMEGNPSHHVPQNDEPSPNDTHNLLATNSTVSSETSLLDSQDFTGILESLTSNSRPAEGTIRNPLYKESELPREIPTRQILRSSPNLADIGMSETESKCVKFKNASDLKYSCRDPTRQITRSLPGDVPRNVLESPGQRKFVTRRKLGLAALSNTSLKPEDSEDKSNWNFRRGQGNEEALMKATNVQSLFDLTEQMMEYIRKTNRSSPSQKIFKVWEQRFDEIKRVV